jgi:hypothetical protein
VWALELGDKSFGRRKQDAQCASKTEREKLCVWRERSYAYGERKQGREEARLRERDRERDAMPEAMRERTYECKQDREREPMRRKQDGGGGGQEKRFEHSACSLCVHCVYPSNAPLFLRVWCSSSCFTGVTLVASGAVVAALLALL